MTRRDADAEAGTMTDTTWQAIEEHLDVSWIALRQALGTE